MKKSFFIVVLFLIISCGNSGVEKPENLLSQAEMTAIFYDMALLQSIQTTQPFVLDKYSIKPTDYIYKKYEIDSATFFQNNKYYASDPKTYKKMFDEVTKKLDESMPEIEQNQVVK